MKNLNIFKRSLTLAMILLMVLNSMVLADNVQNDIVKGGNDTINVGGSTTVNYSIAENSGDGEKGCNATDSSPATVTINVPNGVTANPIELEFKSCDIGKSVVFSSEIKGDFDITVSVDDSGSGTYNTNPAKFTLHVLAPSDSTPPVITPSVVGTKGNDPWYVSDVTVSWSFVDAESTITSTSGCGPTTISTDTAGVTLTCSATSAGGTSSESVTIKRDTTPPGITWNGIPDDGIRFYFGSVPPVVTCTATDGLSGPKSCEVAEFGTLVGTHSLSAIAYDLAGNETVENISYTVLPWTLNGFYKPVDMGDDVWNTVKGGSTVPLKFEIFAGSTELISTDNNTSFMTKPVVCPGGTGEEFPIEFTTTGGTSLRYDSVAGQFIQNWQTPKLPGKCYVVTMTTDDGSSLSAFFKLK